MNDEIPKLRAQLCKLLALGKRQDKLHEENSIKNLNETRVGEEKIVYSQLKRKEAFGKVFATVSLFVFFTELSYFLQEL
jgi:hypothetical protein